MVRSCRIKFQLTIFGRSLVLIASELLANAGCWVVAWILFGRHRETQPILSLALLAWTLGLRHALDADHISAIDNATRALIGMGQLPVTCGLYFSLGHSTIVVVVNVAIAVSSDIYDKIAGVSSVGGIVGTAVSASFLFIVGFANSIILWKVVRRYRRARLRERYAIAEPTSEREAESDEQEQKLNRTLMMRILGPIITFVNKPWKMYPVGVLFGLGFDTTSAVALLAVSALAKKGADGKSIPPANVIILPLLFTAGMTIVDSADSILMLYSYSGFAERSFAIFERRAPLVCQDTISAEDRQSQCRGQTPPSPPVNHSVPDVEISSPVTKEDDVRDLNRCNSVEGPQTVAIVQEKATEWRAKKNMISGLSIVLTLMSILVAFSIALIEIMALIGANCGRCMEAANDPRGGGLAGRWWRGWANANNNLGYIGAAIIGSFIAVLVAWYGIAWLARKVKKNRVATTPD